MKIGKQTEKLIREAAVLGFVEGAWWAGMSIEQKENYPRDSVVFANVLRSAKSNKDLYTTLSKVELDGT